MRLQHYQTEDDYWRVRRFFRGLPRPGGAAGGNWDVAQFDYWRWHWLENVVERDPRELCFWTDGRGEIAAVLNQGDPGVCHLHVHPAQRNERLLETMVETAEREYATALRRGGRGVFVWAAEDDALLGLVLRRRGYETFESAHSVEHNGHRTLLEPVGRAPVPEGFTMRSMGGEEEHPRRSLASWRAFHPEEPDEGCDRTGAWYRAVQRSPLYRRDLDVVGVAPGGDIVSFAVAYFDDVTRTGTFVLTGTVPAFEGLGLGRAVAVEALRRLQWLGATDAYASWYEALEGALFESAELLEEWRGRCWMRSL